jgi:mycothiol synthase
MSYRFAVITERGVAIRTATTDSDLEAFNDVRRVVVPNESVPTVEVLRASESPDRLLILAESGGRVVGSGVADRSQVTGGYVAPRVIPEHRRRGVGSGLLRVLLDHLIDRGFGSAGANVEDDASHAFAVHHGFQEVDRQVEQVRTLTRDEPQPPPYEGVEFWTVAQRPELLQRSFALAQQGYADMVLKTGTAVVPIDEWLREEATLPAGTFVALEHGIIVGYAGLLAWTDDPARAENGLTVVDRRWRGRGLATALKQRQLAWAATNGIREIVTWTQEGNEAMQRVNVRLGYEPRSVSRTMRRALP